MTAILLAAFEPFGGEVVNASWEAVKRAKAPPIAGLRLERVCLPCVYKRSVEVLEEALDRLAPDILVLVGQAAGRPDVCVERVALNLDDAALADNDGEVRRDREIAAGGPAAYMTGLDARGLVERLRQAGIPARVSLTAGAYVCNHVFYEATRLSDARNPRIRVGLIHVPVTPGQVEEQSGAPSMGTEQVVSALQLIIAAEAAGMALAV
ncbi:MAG: pyroglutamyl-peptidase I [Bauldia sp.]